MMRRKAATAMNISRSCLPTQAGNMNTCMAIQAGDDREKVKDYLSKIQISSNHLLGIVNEVLEMLGKIIKGL
ncbi:MULTISPECIES: hypothetical protein [unclassified Ruminococcus]|uniref:hypothetical protein n=1 Tax=unclassified Ruminococcus TaxID=2608920 RepID=UPI00319E62CB